MLFTLHGSHLAHPIPIRLAGLAAQLATFAFQAQLCSLASACFLLFAHFQDSGVVGLSRWFLACSWLLHHTLVALSWLIAALTKAVVGAVKPFSAQMSKTTSNPPIEWDAVKAAFLRAIRLARRPSFLRWAP